ncbi:hypothetical protein J2X98_001783 [Pseudarthrobacter enclensis]|uniref:Uncharacterized protein n=1 Tax=Pseudarthrobacter enclensis TaxID=993070 RepID=A0ABT9RSH9_9MICC|nr:hypothetical protein [Pseudarthrobacter enclensis]
MLWRAPVPAGPAPALNTRGYSIGSPRLEP